ncbi:MAG: S-layer homology domain-containing protein [Acidimicrobiia bacterium]
MIWLGLLLLMALLPPGGTFVDDDSSVYEGSIEAISAEGLTVGCNPPESDRYCPGRTVTRGEMAAFLTRSLGLGATGGDFFSDDGGHPFERAINRLAEAGVTEGCNPPVNDRFCPDRDMTRGEMAAMLSRAFDYPPSDRDRFSDDDGHLFERAIDRLAEAGVTQGCNPPVNDRFCPDEKVTRGQMAIFLTRSLELAPIRPPSVGTPGSARYWSSDSPFNTPIPDNPRLDPKSTTMTAHLSTQVVFDLYEFGIAIQKVDGSTPRTDVYCLADWGDCPTDSLNPIPMPTDLKPPPGSDGNTAIVDWSRRLAISLHKPQANSDGSWSATWVTVADLNGSGVPPEGGNGSGASHLAGVVELDEIAGGHIDHALVFSTDIACKDVRRYPARKTDGESTLPECVPEGARIQLDPSIDVDQLAVPEGVKTVARALQVYGAYAVDRGGAPIALYFQVAPDARDGFPGRVYDEAGLTKDYFSTDAVPWQRIRVLSSWDGS